MPLVALLLATSLFGCSSLSRTEKGAAAGAGAGAVVGGVIGKATGSTAKGAIIGAVVGGAAGAVIGQQMDKQAAELDQDLEGADVERVGEGIEVTFDSAILFDFDSAQLSSTARTNLSDLGNSLQKYPNTDLVIVGHTDSVGSDSYNQSLSERRAQSAADYLLSQGVAPSRISTVGRGESEPVASNETAAGRAQNRRVVIGIFANEQYRQQLEQQNQ
ncbi:MAG TPA: OmpA family protein [Rhodothermales bacterium]|nr:OmpA family protein [Rhodothermales bacterium]